MSRKAITDVAVLITSCHVSTLSNTAISGIHSTTTTTAVAKNAARPTIADEISANRVEPPAPLTDGRWPLRHGSLP